MMSMTLTLVLLQLLAICHSIVVCSRLSPKASLLLAFGSHRNTATGHVNPFSKRATQPGIASNDTYFYDVAAAPTGPLPAQVSGDAPWTQAETSYQKMITCPLGIAQKEKGIVLLVPGTGANGSETYQQSPYYQGLTLFDICWIDLPNYSLSDMQLAAEFVAYGIRYLAPQSSKTGGKINVVSWSQGGPNVQWASTFWPSLRPFVTGHVSLAPSMRGTEAANDVLCPASNAIGGCLPAVLQQAAGSKYMTVADSLENTISGAYALVPTTIVYTYNDEIVTPQIGGNASSRLIGASNIGLQDICGAGHVTDHFSIVSDVGAYGIALDALSNGRPANASTVDRSYCTRTAQSLGFAAGNSPNNLMIAYRIAIGDQRAGMIKSSLNTLRVPVEPSIQKYVCDRGYATNCTQDGFRVKHNQRQRSIDIKSSSGHSKRAHSASNEPIEVFP